MTWSPRTVRAVVGVTTLCTIGSAGLLTGAGAAVAAPPSGDTTSRGSISQPQSFSFDGMSPGETRSTVVDLASTHPTDGRVVDVRVTTSGDLGASISTSIEACRTPWVDEVCPTGALVLIDGWRDEQSGTSHEDVVLPAGATTSLKVSVTLDDDVPLGATGSIRYDLSVSETDEGAPGTGTDPSVPEGPDGPGGPDGEDSDGRPGDGSPWPGDGALAATGASVWILAALAGGLLGIGAALVRRRRRDAPDQPPGPGTPRKRETTEP